MTRPKALTEAEWLSCPTAGPLLRHLGDHCRVTRVKGGRRRLRLFSCACCRLVWDQFEDERSRWAVEVSERAADGRASRQQVEAAAAGALEVYIAAHQQFGETYHWTAGRAAVLAAAAWKATSTNFLSVEYVQEGVISDVVWPAEPSAAREREARQAQLLRDIFGNPFRPLPTVDPAWLTGRDGAAKRLAEAINDGRRWAELPVLADALEDAGCADADLLGHCRSGGEHARGCWVVDLLLGRGRV